MPEVTSSPEAEHSSNKNDRVRDMAARLFAELFYKQVMAERDQRRKPLDNTNLTDDNKGL
jgi:hypothetical protein